MKIQIADVTIELLDVDEYTKRISRDYLTDKEHTELTIAVSEQEIALVEEENKELDFDRRTTKSFAYLEKLDMEMLAFDAFYLHAATIAVDGFAYAFTAKSGTGKSTHIKLWKQVFGDRAFVVNGDRPFLRRIDNTLYAGGSPWCGKEGWSTNVMVPLKALCFLERGTENKIQRVSDAEVAERIFRQLRLPKDTEKLEKLLAILDWIVKNIPCYRLQCNMELEAAETAYEGMNGKCQGE
ncbi:MAG: hypothetical protein PHR92_08080 [Lachnospiraceae bacterium]|nr:hypothetical protein [Lachnospiraceae bacterium]